MKQIDLFGNEYKPIRPCNKERTKWNRAFQKWSDTESQDGTTSNGKCGYGSMCDYCEGYIYGNPCIRALNNMLKELQLSINYTNRTEEYFFRIWNGDFENGKDD